MILNTWLTLSDAVAASAGCDYNSPNPAILVCKRISELREDCTTHLRDSEATTVITAFPVLSLDLCMCVYVHMVCGHAQMGWAQRTSGVIPQVSPNFFFFWDRVSQLAWNLPCALAGWPVSPRDKLVSASPPLGLQMHSTMLRIFVWALKIELNSLCLQS